MKITFEKILFTEKLDPEILKCSVEEFLFKVQDVAVKLKVPVDSLMLLIDLESAGTFSPSITNSLGYTGLIQFGKVAAQEVGTTRDQLREMNACEQMDYVYLYLKKYVNRMKTLSDIYLAVFFPAAIGKPDDWVLHSRNLAPEKVAIWNPLFDINKDQKLQVWEIKQKLKKRVPKSHLHLV